MSYSEKLKNFMDKENLTIELLACWCYLCPQTISGILKGKKPNPTTSKKILIGTKGEVDLNIPYRSRRLFMKNLYPSRKHASKKVQSKTSVGDH